MAKSRAKRAGKIRGKSPAHNAAPHPLIAGVDMPEAQRGRFVHAVASVPNPHGEVTVKGEIRQHKAVRRVPHFETLYRSKVFDRSVFIALEWYDERLASANMGMFRSALDSSGSGGDPFTHVARPEAVAMARADVAWARGFVPPSLLSVFDGVMQDGETFERLGALIYAGISPDRAKRKASSAFKIAANYLLLGIAHRLGAE